MVSVIIPTMNRMAIVDCAQRLFETTRGAEVELLVVFDGSPDPMEALSSWHVNLDGDGDFWLYTVGPDKNRRRGAIESWNLGLSLSRGENIVFAGDDLWWGDGWLDKALDCHRRCLEGHGMVGFNDQQNDGNILSTHYLADRDFIKHTLGGRIAFPMFQFYCNDTVANILAKDALLFKWNPECIVTHNHYTTGRRQRDELDFENEQKLNEDIRRLEAWIQRGKKIEWEPVI